MDNKKINCKQSNKSVESINNERTLVQFSTVLRQKVIVSTGSKDCKQQCSMQSQKRINYRPHVWL